MMDYQKAQFDQLFGLDQISQSLKTIGAGDSVKINAFIKHYAKDFDACQIETIAMLFDFTDDQKAQAIAQFEKTIEG